MFALGGNAGSFNVMISISGICSLFFSSSSVVVFSLGGGLLLEVSKMMVFYLTVFSISMSSSKTSLGAGG